MTTPLSSITLDDKYIATEGRIFISGTQALVKLPLLQRRLDLAAGLNTAGFISGYRGSPLGNFDYELWRAKKFLAAEHIEFRPGVNEDLAATSCWGTQQIGLIPGAKYDGVFAMWYGKGPGVDRAGDPFKHGNLAGTMKAGGVLVLTGDDHAAKSSTTAHQSEYALISAMMPILNPASIQDYLDFGIFGWAMSRFASVWVGFKCLTETIESSGTVIIDPSRFRFRSDALSTPNPIQRRFAPLADEQELLSIRLPAAQAFARANGIDQALLWPERKTLGIITVGKSTLDVEEALTLLGFDHDQALAAGIGLFKVGMSWPLEPFAISQFARRFQEVLVIEEKRPLVEEQLAHILYNMRADERPQLSGKRTPDGAPLLQPHGELSPELIALAIAHRLQLHAPDDRLATARNTIDSRLKAASLANVVTLNRTPAFCSGCPHNTSTRIPDGSVALAGIGCHTLALYLADRPTLPPTQMGGEGANWIGMSPFTDTPHVFQNLGDGTYFHSGLMAIRAAVAAKVTVTYKILYNDAVAMTGGQPVDGPLSVKDIIAQVKAEGVKTIALVSDDPKKFKAAFMPRGTTIYHRDDLIAVEKDLRDQSGVTVLVYEQTCAAEKRRRRKRGKFPDPAKRYFINTAVCEGCGDCGKQSNCVSLFPADTSWGRKRQIDQSSCNKDYSCVKGFCPSFVTVLGGALKTAPRKKLSFVQDTPLPPPPMPALGDSYNILVTGIGGTGVVTIGALIGMAAHLDGLACRLLDLTGMSQKNGAVMSHIRLTTTVEQLRSGRIGVGHADAVIACDLVTAAGTDARKTYAADRTRVILNTHLVPTAAFQQNPNLVLDADHHITTIAAAAKTASADQLDATTAAQTLFGSALLANILLLGFAWQRGLVPLSEAALFKAIDLNGVAVDDNRAAFEAGRYAAVDPATFHHAVYGDDAVEQNDRSDHFETIFADRMAFLTAYQDLAYAEKFRAFVLTVATAEERIAPGQRDLSLTVTRTLSKLMAYKDEYEVARLFTDGSFKQDLDKTFTGDITLRYNFAPPLLSRRDPVTGHLKKREFGPWILPVLERLARFRKYRGTAFDIFGYTSERRMERGLIDSYRALVEELLISLSPERLALAIEIANHADTIRGYGHVKEANVALYKSEIASLMARYRDSKSLAA